MNCDAEISKFADKINEQLSDFAMKLGVVRSSTLGWSPELGVYRCTMTFQNWAFMVLAMRISDDMNAHL